MTELPKLIIIAQMWCPHCGVQHVDEDRNGERWSRRAHTTHRCQGCGQDFDVYVSGASEPMILRTVDREDTREGCQDGECGHASDCAVHNEPAMPAGPCDCGFCSPRQPVALNIGWVLIPTDPSDNKAGLGVIYQALESKTGEWNAGKVYRDFIDACPGGHGVLLDNVALNIAGVTAWTPTDFSTGVVSKHRQKAVGVLRLLGMTGNFEGMV